MILKVLVHALELPFKPPSEIKREFDSYINKTDYLVVVKAPLKGEACNLVHSLTNYSYQDLEKKNNALIVESDGCTGYFTKEGKEELEHFFDSKNITEVRFSGVELFHCVTGVMNSIDKIIKDDNVAFYLDWRFLGDCDCLYSKLYDTIEANQIFPKLKRKILAL